MPQKQTQVKVGETTYKLQKVSARDWARLLDRAKNRFGVYSEEQFYDEILKYLVVDPKVSLDDFDDFAEAQQLVKEAVTFQSGSSAFGGGVSEESP